jgi:hypothetical protein
VTSHYRNEVKESARKTVLRIWALDGHRLDPKADPNEKDERIKEAVVELLADDAFLLGEDEKVR